MGNKAETPYLETEFLLAVQNEDEERTEEILLAIGEDGNMALARLISLCEKAAGKANAFLNKLIEADRLG